MHSFFKKFKNSIALKLVALLVVVFAAIPYTVHADWLTDGIFNAVSSLVGMIIFIISFIFGMFIALETWFIQILLYLNTDIVNSPVVQAGFPIALGFANLGFVVVFIVLAIGTILGASSYGYKQTLFKLVMAAIFVNFSLILAGSILRVSDQLSFYFLSQINPGKNGVESLALFADKMAGAFQPQKVFTGVGSTAEVADQVKALTGGILTALPQLAISLIFLVGIFITLGVFIGMLTVRYLLIAILLILMPLAWLSSLIKGYEKYWNEWWQKFTQWAFFSPIVLFFIWLAILTSQGLSDNKQGAVNYKEHFSNPTTSSVFVNIKDSVAGLLAGMAGDVFNSIVVIGLMMGGFMAAQKMGIALAGAAGKYFDNARGAITNTLLKKPAQAAGGGILANQLTGKLATALQGSNTYTGRFLGRFAGAKIDALRQKRIESVRKKYADRANQLSSDSRVAQIKSGNLRGVELVEFLKAAKKNGETGKIDNFDARVKEAEKNLGWGPFSSVRNYGQEKDLKGLRPEAARQAELTAAKKDAKDATIAELVATAKDSDDKTKIVAAIEELANRKDEGGLANLGTPDDIFALLTSEKVKDSFNRFGKTDPTSSTPNEIKNASFEKILSDSGIKLQQAAEQLAQNTDPTKQAGLLEAVTSEMKKLDAEKQFKLFTQFGKQNTMRAQAAQSAIFNYNIGSNNPAQFAKFLQKAADANGLDSVQEYAKSAGLASSRTGQGEYGQMSAAVENSMQTSNQYKNLIGDDYKSFLKIT